MYHIIRAYLLTLIYRCPLSVKGVVMLDGKIVLLKNERDEWELPGGKPEPGESPARCVQREISEELNLDTRAVGVIDSWRYDIFPGARVIILTYMCAATGADTGGMRISHEHQELELFSPGDIAQLRMPRGYLTSIFRAGRRYFPAGG